MSKPWLVPLAGVVLIGIMAVARIGYVSRSRTQSSCYAGVDEQCPPEAWMKDFQWLKEKQEKYRAPQDVIDQMNGVNQRLRQSIPPGYEWNEGKEKFVKTKAATPQPTPEVKK